ncbi:uncharacterized protein [Watersipora subatra]|uniref:uncharacterized protein n=1 Tax=Watersipora subatra TaxID=2589382 RepID=UPI00355C58E6
MDDETVGVSERFGHDVTINSLAAYAAPRCNHECNACIDKGGDIEEAVVYCEKCKRMYCRHHKEDHAGAFGKHSTLAIDDYDEQEERFNASKCTHHPTEECHLVCEHCLEVFCISCISPNNVCTNGKDHLLSNCPAFVAKLKSEFDKRVDAMRTAERSLENLLKQTEIAITNFGQETDEMLNLLNETKDKQIAAIKAQYKELEEELQESREKTKRKMTEFKEGKVNALLTSLIKKRSLIEYRQQKSHLVDIIKMHKNEKAARDQKTDDPLPKLLIDDSHQLQIKDQRRDIEVGIVTADTIAITFAPPKSLVLQKSVRTSGFCHGMCHYEGNLPAIVSNQLVIPDYRKSQIIVHSLDGTVSKKVRHSALKENGVSVCAIDINSVIITTFSDSKVCKVDLSSEKEIWVCTNVKNPQAVILHEGKCETSVAGGMGDKLVFGRAGKKLGELAAGISTEGSRFIDLAIINSTVAIYDEASGLLSFYKMEY